MGPPSKSPPPGGLPCYRVAAVELQGDQPGPGRRRRHLGAVRGRGSIFTGKLSRLVTLEQISFCRKIPPGGGGLGYTKPPTQAGTRSSIYHQGRLFQLSLVVVATKAPEVRLLRYSRRRVRGATYTVGIGAECHRGSVPRVLRRAWYPENRGAIASTGHRSPEISPLKPLSQAPAPYNPHPETLVTGSHPPITLALKP